MLSHGREKKAVGLRFSVCDILINVEELVQNMGFTGLNDKVGMSILHLITSTGSLEAIVITCTLLKKKQNKK